MIGLPSRRCASRNFIAYRQWGLKRWGRRSKAHNFDDNPGQCKECCQCPMELYHWVGSRRRAGTASVDVSFVLVCVL
eukprot:scaffold4791_cov76-Skeletonema_marinoi.AAC.1